MTMKREFIKRFLLFLLIVVILIGNYFYFSQTGHRLDIINTNFLQVLLLTLLYGLNIIYCSVVLRKKVPALLKPVIIGITVVPVIIINSNRTLDFRPVLLLMVIASTLLSISLYFVSRNRPDVMISENKREDFSVKKENMKGLLWWSLGSILIVGMSYFSNVRVDILFFHTLLLIFFIGVNLIYSAVILEKRFPVKAKSLKEGLIVGGLFVEMSALNLGHRYDMRLQMIAIFAVSTLLSIILYLAVRRKPARRNPDSSAAI